MHFDEKIKHKLLLNPKFNFFKFIYFFFNKLKSTLLFKISFSQSPVDLILKDIFKDKSNGFYVDVGCQHPIKNNNTYLLHKKGWRGVNIDLDKYNIEIFNFNRKNDFNINEAVSDKIEILDLYFFHSKSPINTLNKVVSEIHSYKPTKKIKISANTLNNILDKLPVDYIDVLSIDVEGFELKVLKGLNFNKYKPKILIIEYLDLNAQKLDIIHNNINNVINSELYNFIISNKYNLISWVKNDLIFVNNNYKY